LARGASSCVRSRAISSAERGRPMFYPSVESYCEHGDCSRPAFRGNTCAAHLKRMQRGQPLSTPIAEPLSPEERLLDAMGRLMDTPAEDDDAYRHNKSAVIRAAVTLMRNRGWRPPGETKRTRRRR